jgi:hypothetical protein
VDQRAAWRNLVAAHGSGRAGYIVDNYQPSNLPLFVPDELKWMVDFDAAVAAGLGLKIDLDREQSALGFDRLLVFGLQLSLDEAGGKAALEDLLRHHTLGRAGLSLAPQGTTTHNTTGKGADYTTLDDADQSFDDRKNAPLFTLTSDSMQKSDGQWLAELLGIDPTVLTGVHAAGGGDQMRSRAMQRALWPATMGYGWINCWRRSSVTMSLRARAGSSPTSLWVAGRPRLSASAALWRPTDYGLLTHRMARPATRRRWLDRPTNRLCESLVRYLA